MKIYLVGGAVRDQFLQRPVKDNDWVVTGATAQDMLDRGYRQVGSDFPVFLHPDSKEEYALARTERKSGKGYQGFICDFSPDITLEEDLQRRDLTINAMAQAQDGTLVDPYGGQRDIRERLLRHVSSAFAEDPLRVLRVARFAARFADLGFTVAPETMSLMQQMVAAGELEHLVPERVWTETSRALGEARPDVYIQVLRDSGALAVWFEEIAALFGVPQNLQWHPEEDTGVHTLMVLTQAARLSDDINVRWAALLHDLGKAATPENLWPEHPGHEEAGMARVRALCTRLKAPNDARQLALHACEFHGRVHRIRSSSGAAILTLFDRLDLWRRPESLEPLLLVCTADARGRPGHEDEPYPQAAFCREALQVALEVTAKQMMAQGHKGAEIRTALANARAARLDEWLAEKNPS
ncbi:MAG TPA: multifunctional CCA addition/repair protein [Oceanospirillales bacterium]|nr:multifunctional CCA addition/repair protein [Oceanospirillaceae bacterium]MAR01448.1 multifunctional CCA addition/repair protein [Oceanospirillaceae bacterium]HBS42606.1 multifunctional CCA addition/repair protein [Oceanospirillales bacterium]